MRFLLILVGVALSGAPPQPVSLTTGQTLYKSYCASCHGAEGGGDGPVAQSLVMRPTDLRKLTITNGGKFPVYRVVKMLGGADEIAAHGGKQMPVWGPAFREKSPKDEKLAERVRQLVGFLESIQDKPSK